MCRIDHFQVQNEVQHSFTLLTSSNSLILSSNLFNKQTVLFHGPSRGNKYDCVLIINQKVCQGVIVAHKKSFKIYFRLGIP